MIALHSNPQEKVQELEPSRILIYLKCAETPITVSNGVFKRVSFGTDTTPYFQISNTHGTIAIPEKAIKGISFCYDGG